MSETDLQSHIMRALQSWGCWCQRVNTGMWGRIKFGLGRGGPDILVLDNGIAIAIEVKTKTGTMSDAQLAWREDWLHAGGKYAMVRSVSDAIGVLQENRRKLKKAVSDATP